MNGGQCALSAKSVSKIRNMENRTDTIDDVLRKLNGISTINCGGCGISALSIYRWMIKNEACNDKCEFLCVYKDDTKDRYMESMKNLSKNNTKELLAPNHVYLKIGKDLIDSRGRFSAHRYPYAITLDEETHLLDMINKVDEWNYQFSRKKNVAVIESMLDIDLSDVSTDSHCEEMLNVKESLISWWNGFTRWITLKLG